MQERHYAIVRETTEFGRVNYGIVPVLDVQLTRVQTEGAFDTTWWWSTKDAILIGRFTERPELSDAECAERFDSLSTPLAFG